MTEKIKKRTQGRPPFWDNGKFTTITIKLEPRHKDKLFKLAQLLDDNPSHIVRRLIIEELYFRGMSDDGATNL